MHAIRRDLPPPLSTYLPAGAHALWVLSPGTPVDSKTITSSVDPISSLQSKAVTLFIFLSSSVLSDCSPLDWSIWLAYLWLLFLLYDKPKQTHQTAPPPQNTRLNHHTFPSSFCPSSFFVLLLLLLFRAKPLEAIIFIQCLFFQSLKLTHLKLTLIFTQRDVLVNVKQPAFWRTKPWFETFSDFHGINMYSCQGWFHAMRTDFKLSNVVFGRDVLSWRPRGLGGFVCMSVWFLWASSRVPVFTTDHLAEKCSLTSPPAEL